MCVSPVLSVLYLGGWEGFVHYGESPGDVVWGRGVNNCPCRSGGEGVAGRERKGGLSNNCSTES